MGIDSSAPTTPIGMTGTPARIAISTNPPRPKRRRRYRSAYVLDGPLVPSGKTTASWPWSRSRRRALSGCAGSPPTRAHIVPSHGVSRKK